MILCACGCGLPVTRRKGRPNRYLKGHAQAKLTYATAAAIRAAQGPLKALAARYVVSEPVIVAVRQGRSWRPA